MGYVNIGTVPTFPNVKPDKAQVLKISEEEHEIYSAWENCTEEDLDPDAYHPSHSPRYALIDECCDTIQAISNFLASIGVSDLTEAMECCTRRNHERGRL